MDELMDGAGDAAAIEATEATEAGRKRKPRRRNIFARRKAPAGEETRKGRVVLEQNVFGRVTKELQVADPEAAVHWDIRCWRRLR